MNSAWQRWYEVLYWERIEEVRLEWLWGVYGRSL